MKERGWVNSQSIVQHPFAKCALYETMLQMTFPRQWYINQISTEQVKPIQKGTLDAISQWRTILTTEEKTWERGRVILRFHTSSICPSLPLHFHHPILSSHSSRNPKNCRRELSQKRVITAFRSKRAVNVTSIWTNSQTTPSANPTNQQVARPNSERRC